MKKINLLLTSIFTLIFLISSLSLFSQAKITVDESSGLVEIFAQSGDDFSAILQQYDDQVTQFQEKASEMEEADMSPDQLADLMSGMVVFTDKNGVRNSLLANKKSAYLTMFRQFGEVAERSEKSKDEIEYDARLTTAEEYYLAVNPGLAYVLRRINDTRNGFIVNVSGKRVLVVEDNEGNSGITELEEREDPIKRGREIELRGNDCYKTGFKSKFSGSYWSKWMWHSMGFAGYSYDFTIFGINFTAQGYASYAKVASFKKWLVVLTRGYKTKLSVTLNGSVYNSKCQNSKTISKSNSKNKAWLCTVTAKGLWKSTIKNGSLKSKATAQNVGTSNISIK